MDYQMGYYVPFLITLMTYQSLGRVPHHPQTTLRDGDFPTVYQSHVPPTKEYQRSSSFSEVTLQNDTYDLELATTNPIYSSVLLKLNKKKQSGKHYKHPVYQRKSIRTHTSLADPSLRSQRSSAQLFSPFYKTRVITSHPSHNEVTSPSELLDPEFETDPLQYLGTSQGYNLDAASSLIDETKVAENECKSLTSESPDPAGEEQVVDAGQQIKGGGMPYDFSYGVADIDSGNTYGHSESSDGDLVTGEYQVLLPDGRTMIVSYIANGERGYVPRISYKKQN